MADDMGYSDIGCYGGEIQTPNLDALAAKGVRFTQFYNTARCCPTRAALLTGLYPHQAGVGHMMDDRNHDGYRGNLNQHCRTIAEVLKPAGYATYMSGKWHVTRHIAPEGPKFNWPLQRGFDRFFGTIHGAGSFYDPNSLTRDNTQIPPDSDDFYYTDAINDHAVKFISEHKAKQGSQPFFLYIAHTAPHWPMHAKPQDIAKYKGRYNQGWDALRQERHQRMIQMGLVKKEWPLTERDKAAPAWDETSDKEWHVRRMEVYAAMVDSMDQGIGRVIAALKQTGHYDNTLILFLADNGGCAEENGSKGPIRPDPTQEVVLQPMEPGELQKAMVPARTRDGRPVRQGEGVMPGPADTYVAYGLPWANASNTPFRWYKKWDHEGGIATPLIAHWPDVITNGGAITGAMGHVIDLMATCVDVAGASYPTRFNGHDILPLEGRSLAPVFLSGSRDGHPSLCWEHFGNRAIRQGQWKLVAEKDGPWELYDMEADRTELNDLAGTNPERVRELETAWTQWAKRVYVRE